MDANDIRLDGRVIVVAGAGGGGIGTASAVLLAKAGATVIGIDRSEAGRAVAEAALDGVGHSRIIDCDLTDKQAVRAMIAAVETTDGPIRGVLNVVGGMQGIEQFAPLLVEDGDDIFRTLIDTNLTATLNCSVEAARAMLAHGLGGSIVQIASATGLVSMAFGGGYGAAKAALLNLTRTMAVEWGAGGVRVNAIAVGMIRTAQSENAVKEVEQAARLAIPLGRVGYSDEIAGPVLFLMSDLASYVTGATIGVDGGSMARAPYNDAENLPVFVNDPDLRSRLRTQVGDASGGRTHAQS